VKPINLYASQPHYFDHLAPIWHGLEPEERGLAFAASGPAWLHAARLGIHCVPGAYRDYPWGRRTIVHGHQPLVLVASWRDHRHTSRARTVYLEHGAGQHYNDDDGSGQTAAISARSRVALFLLPGPYSARLVADAYPSTPIAEVGCPKLDTHAGATTPNADPVVAFTWHWTPAYSCPERRPALPFWEAALTPLIAALAAHGVRPLGHAHPRAWAALRPVYSALDVDAAPYLDDVFDIADLLVADNTSAAYEFAALGRPVVLLDAPWYRRDVEHGLRFWRLSTIGPRVGTGSWTELATAILQQLSGDLWADRRQRTLAGVYAAPPGKATSLALDALAAHLP